MRIQAKKFSDRERAVFGVAAALIAAGILYFFVVDPAIRQWREIDSSVAVSGSKLLKNLKLLTNQDALEKEYAEYKEYVQRPAGKDDELSMILKEVESMASLSGVKITSVKPKGEKNLPAYREYMVELSCEGKLDEYMKYIYELEGSKRLLKVERLILTLKGSGSDLLKAAIIIRKISF